MKLYFYAFISCILALNFLYAAEPPQEVIDQLKQDFQTMIAERGDKTATKEQIESAVQQLVLSAQKELPEAFIFSTDEIQAFKSGKSSISNDDLKAAFNDLKEASQSRHLPVLIDFYHSVDEKGGLNAVQRIFYLKALKIITNKTKLQNAKS